MEVSAQQLRWEKKKKKKKKKTDKPLENKIPFLSVLFCGWGYSRRGCGAKTSWISALESA